MFQHTKVRDKDYSSHIKYETRGLVIKTTVLESKLLVARSMLDMSTSHITNPYILGVGARLLSDGLNQDYFNLTLVKVMSISWRSSLLLHVVHIMLENPCVHLGVYLEMYRMWLH